MRYLIAFLFLTLAVACGDDGTPPADGGADSGMTDGGTGDSSLADSGPSDTGPGDTGLADSGPGDTGPADAGPSCTDGVMNGTETDVDCGGDCDACADGLMCAATTDCVSGVCDSTAGTCTAPTCMDTVMNQDETDVDCGGATCDACDDGGACTIAADCMSGVCVGNVCLAAECGDSVQNGDETDVDCGGSCGACGDGLMCVVADDCTSGVCDGTASTCTAPTCMDTVMNQDETDVDCGGATCGACDIGMDCAVAADCTSSFCSAGTCQYATDCYELRSADATLADGRYTVDLDGAGTLSPMTVQCDMTTDGGGWMLVLNYLHQGGTNPGVVALSDTLPLEGSTTLGDDESTVAANWGHASNAMMTAVNFDETMWFGVTSAHPRVIHFKTNSPGVKSYIQSGTGSMNPTIYDPTYTTGLGRRDAATLPLHIAPNNRLGYANRGDLAMTAFPFFGNSAIGNPRAHWGVGQGSRWEADGPCCGTSVNDTHHQIWARPNPCTDGMANFGETDVDCGGSCGGCAATETCVADGDCLSGDCTGGSCVDTTLATSCNALLTASPGIADGAYTLDVDGAGGADPFLAYCDMTFDGGGWTLALSTAYGGDPASSTEGEVLMGTTTHMPDARVAALAALSTQTHVRTHDTEATRSVTSVASSSAITNLGSLVMLENGASGPGDIADWTGPFADLAHLQFACATFTGDFPSVYQCCGTNGMHLWSGQGGHSRWNWLAGNRGLNEPMELWVR